MSAPQIVTVSGLPGSGTSTACDHLCAGLGWAYVNAGELFRQLAQESGQNLAEFGRQAEKDGRIDRQLDELMVVRARAEAPIVIEGRLTGWMAHRHELKALKIWLKAESEIRAERLGRRESKPVAQAMEEMREREGSEARRYEEHHHICCDDLSIYDLVIDSGSMDAQAVVAQIFAQLGRS